MPSVDDPIEIPYDPTAPIDPEDPALLQGLWVLVFNNSSEILSWPANSSYPLGMTKLGNGALIQPIPVADQTMTGLFAIQSFKDPSAIGSTKAWYWVWNEYYGTFGKTTSLADATRFRFETDSTASAATGLACYRIHVYSFLAASQGYLTLNPDAHSRVTVSWMTSSSFSLVCRFLPLRSAPDNGTEPKPQLRTGEARLWSAVHPSRSVLVSGSSDIGVLFDTTRLGALSYWTTADNAIGGVELGPWTTVTANFLGPSGATGRVSPGTIFSSSALSSIPVFQVTTTRGANGGYYRVSTSTAAIDALAGTWYLGTSDDVVLAQVGFYGVDTSWLALSPSNTSVGGYPVMPFPVQLTRLAPDPATEPVPNGGTLVSVSSVYRIVQPTPSLSHGQVNQLVVLASSWASSFIREGNVEPLTAILMPEPDGKLSLMDADSRMYVATTSDTGLPLPKVLGLTNDYNQRCVLTQSLRTTPRTLGARCPLPGEAILCSSPNYQNPENVSYTSITTDYPGSINISSGALPPSWTSLALGPGTTAVLYREKRYTGNAFTATRSVYDATAATALGAPFKSVRLERNVSAFEAGFIAEIELLQDSIYSAEHARFDSRDGIYRIVLSWMDVAGNPLSNALVSITTTSPTDVFIAGASRRLDLASGAVWDVRTDALGQVVVSMPPPTDQLTAPLVYARRNASGDEPWGVFDPSQALFQKLSTATGDGLANGVGATDGNARRDALLPAGVAPSDANNLAASLNALATAVAFRNGSAADVELVPPSGGATASPQTHVRLTMDRRTGRFQTERHDSRHAMRAALTRHETSQVVHVGRMPLRHAMEAFSFGWSDIVDFGISVMDEVAGAIEAGWSWVKKEVSIAISWIEDQVTYLAEWIMETAQDVVEVVESMFHYLEVTFDQVLRFFQFIFDWDKILDTQRTLLDTMTSVLDDLGASLHAIVQSAHAALAESEQAAHDGLTQLAEWLGYSSPDPATWPAAIKGQPGTSPYRGGQPNNWLVSKLNDTQSAWGGITPSALPSIDVPDLGSALTDALSGFETALAQAREPFEGQPENTLNYLTGQALGIANAIVTAAYAAASAVLDALAAGTDTIIAGLVALFDLELQIPVFSSLFASITGGQKLTLRNLASLIIAIPTAVIGSAIEWFTNPSVRQAEKRAARDASFSQPGPLAMAAIAASGFQIIFQTASDVFRSAQVFADVNSPGISSPVTKWGMIICDMLNIACSLVQLANGRPQMREGVPVSGIDALAWVGDCVGQIVGPGMNAWGAYKELPARTAWQPQCLFGFITMLVSCIIFGVHLAQGNVVKKGLEDVSRFLSGMASAAKLLRAPELIAPSEGASAAKLVLADVCILTVRFGLAIGIEYQKANDDDSTP